MRGAILMAKKSKEPVSEDRYITATQSDRTVTTVMLSERHVRLMKAIQYYEFTCNHKVNMGDILEDALNLYQEHYEKKNNVVIKDNGSVVQP